MLQMFGKDFLLVSRTIPWHCIEVVTDFILDSPPNFVAFFRQH